MDKLYCFNFDSRTWSMRHCKRLLPSWTFGHAVRRKRSIFAYGSVQGDFGHLEVEAPQYPDGVCSGCFSPRTAECHAHRPQTQHVCIWQHPDTLKRPVDSQDGRKS